MIRPSENARAAQNIGCRAGVPAAAEWGAGCDEEARPATSTADRLGVAAAAVPTLSWQPLTGQVKNAFDVKRLGEQIEQMCPLDSVTRTHQGT